MLWKVEEFRQTDISNRRSLSEENTTSCVLVGAPLSSRISPIFG